MIYLIDKLENIDAYFSGEQKEEKNLEYESQTPPRATGTMDGKYNYMPLGSNKPCIYVKSCWPNLEWRTLNSNILSFIANFLASTKFQQTIFHFL